MFLRKSLHLTFVAPPRKSLRPACPPPHDILARLQKNHSISFEPCLSSHHPTAARTLHLKGYTPAYKTAARCKLQRAAVHTHHTRYRSCLFEQDGGFEEIPVDGDFKDTIHQFRQVTRDGKAETAALGIAGFIAAFEALHEFVRGDIQAVYPYEDPVALICNEEGKLMGLPLNRALFDDDGHIYDIVSGNFLIVGLGEENFTDLSPDLMEKYGEQFKYPEKFARLAGEIIAVKQPATNEHREKPMMHHSGPDL